MIKNWSGGTKPCADSKSRFCYKFSITRGRAFGCDGLSAPRHTPARVRAKEPKQEYKREAFELFTSMLDQIKRESVRVLTAVQVPSKEEIEVQEEERRRQAVEQLARAEATHENASVTEASAGQTEPERPMPAVSQKVGRNEPCPCGSGKKYKQCCGRIG